MASSWVSAERHVTPMMAFQFAIIYVTSMGKDLDVLEGFQKKIKKKIMVSTSCAKNCVLLNA
jgi:hypothetical protein